MIKELRWLHHPKVNNAEYAVDEGYLLIRLPMVEVLPTFQSPMFTGLPFCLTNREKEVADYLIKLTCNKEIAIALRITERTVKFHVGSILHKLGVHSRWEATEILKKSSVGQKGELRDEKVNSNHGAVVPVLQ